MITHSISIPFKFFLVVLIVTSISCNAVTSLPIPGINNPGTPSSGLFPSGVNQPQGPWVANDLAWSPDQAFLVVATDKGLNFHDPTSGNLVFSKLNNSSINSLAFSHNGKMLATSGVNAFLMDTSDWKEKKISSDGRVYGIAFSPDDQLLAVSQLEGILVMDIRTGNKIQSLEPKADDPYANYYPLVFSPDGKYLASGTHNSPQNAVRLWDVATGKLIHDFGNDSFYNYQGILYFSDDGKSLNASYYTWDMATYEVTGTGSSEILGISPRGNYKITREYDSPEHEYLSFETLSENAPAIPDLIASSNHVAFSPDENMLAYIENTQGHVLLQTFNSTPKIKMTFSDVYGNFEFLPNDNSLAMAKSDGVSIYNFGTQQSQFLPVNNLSQLIGFSPDEKTMVISTTESTIEFWDMNAQKSRFSLSEAGQGLSFSLDSKLFYTVIPDESNGRMNINIFDADTGEKLQSYSTYLLLPYLFSISEDQSVIALPDLDTSYFLNPIIYESTTHTELSRLDFGSELVGNFALSPDGKFLIASSMLNDQEVRISYWEVSTGKNINNMTVNRPVDSILRLFISKDGKKLAMVGKNNTPELEIYDIPTLSLMPESASSCEDVYFLKDNYNLAYGEYLLCGGQFWNDTTALNAQRIENDILYDPMATAINKKIWARQTEKIIILSSLETNKEILRFPAFDLQPAELISSKLLFSQDGNMLAAGNYPNKEIILWDMSYSGPQSSSLPGYVKK